MAILHQNESLDNQLHTAKTINRIVYVFFQKCVSEYIRNNKYQQSTFFESGRDRENINVR